MAYHKDFSVVIGTAASVIAVAGMIAYNLMASLVSWYRRQRRSGDPNIGWLRRRVLPELACRSGLSF